MKCPLCQSPTAAPVTTISTENLQRSWLKTLQIDIIDEIEGYEQVSLYKCAKCHLRYFDPGLAGSDKLYAQLQMFDWYYMPDKWEHRAALQDIHKEDRVLEVGCGRGAFVRRLVNLGTDVTGIELNEKAATEAQESGLPVFVKSLKDLANERAGTFDVVCHFQVLEHVPNPSEFLKCCIQLLKPKGRLLLCVPNNDGFIQLDRHNLLNQPPHHITQWSAHVFRIFPILFPLVCKRICYEPLAEYHLDWFINLQFSRLPKIRGISWRMRSSFEKILLPFIRHSRIYRIVRGHSIYVAYSKVR